MQGVHWQTLQAFDAVAGGAPDRELVKGGQALHVEAQQMSIQKSMQSSPSSLPVVGKYLPAGQSR